MPTDQRYQVHYTCLRCGTDLEAITDEWQDWRKCPNCGKAGRPPFQLMIEENTPEDVLYIGMNPDMSTTVTESVTLTTHYAPNPMLDYPTTPSNSVRVIYGLGFFIAAVLALISVAQKSGQQAGVLAILAVFFLVMLIRATGRS
jgi:hypothetical protein